MNERKPISEIINELVEKQEQLTKLNDELARYNRNADNEGCESRLEIVRQMQNLLNEITRATEQIKKY